MKKRMIGYAAWVLLAACLYFFENNTGTRIVLAGSLLLPLIPFFRREQPAPPGEKKQRAAGQTVGSFLTAEQEDRGDVRAYLPGDPVNRIHWKLSAKRDELLIREQEEVSAEEPVRGTTELPAVPDRRRKRMMLSGIPVILSAVLLLALLPSARMGMQALCNRLFDASEAVNAYAYDRFAVPADQPALFAGILLAVIPAAAVGMTLLSGRRWPAPVLLAGCVLFQVYFGLSFPAWINIGLFASAALWMLRPLTRKTLLSLAAGAALLSLAVTFFWPGTDAATEAASERVRDSLSRMAGLSAGEIPEQPDGETETWHTHSLSLTDGDREAGTGREYRLETVEEEQISMPHRFSWLKTLLLLLLTVLLLILPFLPFAMLNRRRRKALEARKVFQSENLREAVAAIFQQVISWMEAMGCGAGNVPYRFWDESFREDALPPGYAQRFRQCALLFEEAVYSGHELREEQREQVLALLRETEDTMMKKADRKQRLRLKYRECLWI